MPDEDLEQRDRAPGAGESVTCTAAPLIRRTRDAYTAHAYRRPAPPYRSAGTCNPLITINAGGIATNESPIATTATRIATIATCIRTIETRITTSAMRIATNRHAGARAAHRSFTRQPSSTQEHA